MQQFSVGDKIVHPGIGAGTITGTRHQELVAGFEYYYVIQLIEDKAVTYIPMQKASELGVRLAMSRAELSRVLDVLSSNPHALSGDYRKRQEQIEERLKTNQPVIIAETVRDLLWHERLSHLTTKDGDLLAQGRKILAEEIALVIEAQTKDVNQLIGETLAAAMFEKSADANPAKRPTTSIRSAAAEQQQQDLSSALAQRLRILGLPSH